MAILILVESNNKGAENDCNSQSVSVDKVKLPEGTGVNESSHTNE